MILSVIFSNDELIAQSYVHYCLRQFYMMDGSALIIFISILWTDQLGFQTLNDYIGVGHDGVTTHIPVPLLSDAVCTVQQSVKGRGAPPNSRHITATSKTRSSVYSVPYIQYMQQVVITEFTYKESEAVLFSLRKKISLSYCLNNLSDMSSWIDAKKCFII
jgi:hypothetical protein